MKRIRRVVYATDFATASRGAFRAAVALSTALNARLTLVHVVAAFLPVLTDQYVDDETVTQIERRARQSGLRRLNGLAERARRSGARVTTHLREGDAVGEIIRAARSSKADLIVVGTHGRRGMPRFFLGSVAERVARMAPCPVMIVRGK